MNPQPVPQKRKPALLQLLQFVFPLCLIIGCTLTPVEEGEALKQSGIAAIKAQDYEEALDKFQLSQTKFEQKDLYFWLGITCYYLKQKEKAQAFLKKSLEAELSIEMKRIAENKLSILNQSSQTRYDQDHEEGFGEKEDPGYLTDKTKERLASESFEAGVEAEENQNWEQALDFHNQAIELTRYPPSAIHKGRILLEQFSQDKEKKEEGIQSLQNAIEFSASPLSELEDIEDKNEDQLKEASDIWANMGLVYRTLTEHGYKKEDLAEKAYQNSVKNNEKNHESWNSLGHVYRDQGKLKEAITAYRKAIEHTRKSEDKSYYLNTLAWILATEEEVKKPQEALKLAEEAVSINEIHPNLDTLAECYYQTNQPKKAMQTITKAIETCNKDESEDLEYYQQKLADWKTEFKDIRLGKSQ